jgi:hypothetical protein
VQSVGNLGQQARLAISGAHGAEQQIPYQFNIHILIPALESSQEE